MYARHAAGARFNSSRIFVNSSPNSAYARAKSPCWLKGAKSSSMRKLSTIHRLWMA